MKKTLKDILTNKKTRKMTAKQILIKSARTEGMADWL